MKLLAVIGAAVALCSFSPPEPTGTNSPAIVKLSCGPYSGTAFHIGGGRWLTASHVTVGRECSINGAPVVKVREDTRVDFAELLGPEVPETIRTSCRGFRAAGLYWAIGYAGGVYRLVTPLTATGFGDSDGMSSFIGQVERGMSGGPVLNSRGRAVGIVNRHSPARSRSLRETHICRGER